MNTAYSHYAADASWKIMQTELTLVVICIHLFKLNIFASLQLITSVFLSYPRHKVFVYKCTVLIHILDRFHVSSSPDAPRWTTPTFREPKLPFSFLSLHTIAPSRYNQRRPFKVRHYMIIAWPYHYVAFRILQYRTISMGTPLFLKHQLSKPPSHVKYKKYIVCRPLPLNLHALSLRTQEQQQDHDKAFASVDLGLTRDSWPRNSTHSVRLCHGGYTKTRGGLFLNISSFYESLPSFMFFLFSFL